MLVMAPLMTKPSTRDAGTRCALTDAGQVDTSGKLRFLSVPFSGDAFVTLYAMACPAKNISSSVAEVRPSELAKVLLTFLAGRASWIPSAVSSVMSTSPI